MKKEYLIALIGAAATILASVISVSWGNIDGRKETFNQIQAAFANTSGDNATVIINDVGSLVKSFEDLKKENDGLKILNAQYSDQLAKNTSEIENLGSQLGDAPIFQFQDLILSIHGEDKPIESKNAMAIINGRNYFSKDIVDQVIGNDESLSIKDGMATIGKIISEKANLVDQWVVDQNSCDVGGTAKDSYGNTRTNAIVMNYSSNNIILNLNKKYSMLKCTVAVNEAYMYIDGTTTFQVFADDNLVYTATLNKKTEPFEIDIPISNCTLLTIEGQADKYTDRNIIIANGIVYN